MRAEPADQTQETVRAHNSERAALCTVVITTKNRKEELLGAIGSSLRQTAPLEVLVIDDASTDGTEELVRSRFPQVRYERVPESKGYIVQRNRAARMSRTPIIISIDDDAAFPSARTIEQTLAEFDDPRIGAVAIPYIDVLKGDTVAQRSPGNGGIYMIPTYVGTAHAVRRDLFLRLGGYRECHVHQGEEGDFCLRMLAAGYIVRAGTADPIHHFESPKRDLTRLFRYNARNNILSIWHNVPMPYMPARLAGATLHLLEWGVKKRYLRATLTGLREGYTELIMGRLQRRPVSRAVYRLSRRMGAKGAITLDQAEAILPDNCREAGLASDLQQSPRNPCSEQ